jgi:hypothetical protein
MDNQTVENIFYENSLSDKLKETFGGLIVFFGYLLFALALTWAKRKPIKKALMEMLKRHPKFLERLHIRI